MVTSVFTQVVWSLILVFILVYLGIIWRDIRKAQEQLDLMLVRQNEQENTLKAYQNVLRAFAETQAKTVKETASASQAEHIGVQNENLDVKLDKILEELDSLANNATFGDMLAQGMSEMMNYTGIVGDRREV